MNVTLPCLPGDEGIVLIVRLPGVAGELWTTSPKLATLLKIIDGAELFNGLTGKTPGAAAAELVAAPAEREAVAVVRHAGLAADVVSSWGRCDG